MSAGETMIALFVDSLKGALSVKQSETLCHYDNIFSTSQHMSHPATAGNATPLTTYIPVNSDYLVKLSGWKVEVATRSHKYTCTIIPYSYTPYAELHPPQSH